MGDAAIFRYESQFKVDGYYHVSGGHHVPDFQKVPGYLRPFVQRLWSEVDSSTAQSENSDTTKCPYCADPLANVPTTRFQEEREAFWASQRDASIPVVRAKYNVEPKRFVACGICGFWFIVEETFGVYDGGDFIDYTIAVLRSLEINDAGVGLVELADHLARRVSDIYSLSGRRFEEFVGQVYRDLGYDVRLTQQSRDGGYDIVLLERTGDGEMRQILVECKRYARDRSVGVGVVRQLLGVQLELGVPRAKLVTSARFTKPAVRTAQRVSGGESGYQMELVDIQRLTEMLGVYRNNGIDLVNDPRLPQDRRQAGLSSW